VVGKVAVDSSNHSLEFSDINYISAERTTAALCTIFYSLSPLFIILYMCCINARNMVGRPFLLQKCSMLIWPCHYLFTQNVDKCRKMSTRSPAVADKPPRRESMPKIVPIRRAYNVVTDNTRLSSFV